jgi:hypothetical protein
MNERRKEVKERRFMNSGKNVRGKGRPMEMG